MPEMVMDFVQSKRINSFHKLHFLLFLYQNPGLSGTSENFARHMYLGDIALVQQIMADLSAVGLLECVDQQCRLRDDHSVKTLLHRLHQIYIDPLGRQQLLDVVRRSPFLI